MSCGVRLLADVESWSDGGALPPRVLGGRGSRQDANHWFGRTAKREAAEALPLIDLATVPHVDHKDQHGLVVDAVDHPVVPGAHSPKPW